MTKRKTDKEFKQEVFDLVGNEYIFLEPYAKSSAKIKVKHSKCGKIYQVTPNSFLRGHRCPYCAGLAKKTDAKFKHEVSDLVGGEYTFLEPYVNNKTKIMVKHNKCDNVYKVRPSDFLNGVRCPYCFGTPKKTDVQFKKEVKEITGNEYTFLDSYVNALTKIRVKHNKCGHTYEVQPNNFLSGSRCPYCFGTPRKTNAQFRQEIYNLVDEEYNFLDKYVDSYTKLRVKHNKCGNIYEVTPHAFISLNNRCPYCNSPKGETIISRILDTLSINYEYQKIFDDLKDTNLLSYDFFIPDQNLLIEYQGLQHYKPIEHFGGETTFNRQQKHDKMKADYAKDHGYELIAVPYTEDTFSKIKKYLLKHGLTK